MTNLLEKINNFPKFQVRLGDLLDVRDGTHDTPQRQSQGYQLITSKQIKGGKIEQTDYLISENDFHEVNKRSKVDQWDILISMIGTVGEILLIKEEPSFAIKNIGLLKTNKNEVLAKYIYYYFTSLVGQNEIKANLSGTSQQFISLGRLREIDVSVPKNQSDQKIITEILSAYDAKIENNNLIIKKLEAIAQTLFDEWFVNFRFPGYEKSKFVDSEVGEIPKGWEVKSVLDVIERISPGKKYDNKSASPSGNVPILDQGASGFIGYHDDEPGVIASIDNPVVVFTNHTCYYRILTEPFSCIQNVLPYIGKNGYDTFFVYFLTKEKIKMSEYKGHWPEFEQQVFVIPTPEIANQFSKLAKVFIEKIVSCEKENTSLKSQRDRLLAKLI